MKVFVVFAVALGVGIGLCGLDLVLAIQGIGRSGVGLGASPLDRVSLAVMSISAIGLVITTVFWFIAEVFGSFSQKDTEPQRLFDATEDHSHREEKNRQREP